MFLNPKTFFFTCVFLNGCRCNFLERITTPIVARKVLRVYLFLITLFLWMKSFVQLPGANPLARIHLKTFERVDCIGRCVLFRNRVGKLPVIELTFRLAANYLRCSSKIGPSCI